MRTTTTAAWTAALAVMSVRGPFTTAEAAPARHYDQERPHHVIPKHIRRGGYNSSAPAVDSSSSTSQHRTIHESETDAISPPPVVDQTTRTKRTRSDTQTSPSDDEMLSSFLAEGLLPMTANTVVTTTLTVARNGLLTHDTETYTLTYTETGPTTPTPGLSKTTKNSPVPLPLFTSTSVPLGTAVPVPVPKDTTSTKSTRLPPLGGTHALTHPSAILPTSSNTKTQQQESETSTSTTQGTGLPLLGSNGIIPLSEPSPTRHHKSTETHTRSSDSTTDSGPIIVGLSTTFSLPKGSTRPLQTQSTGAGLLSGVGITGVSTGLSLPTGASGLPASTQSGDGNRKHPNAKPFPPAGFTSSLPSGLPTATGIFPPSSNVVPTGGSTTNKVILPPGVSSDIAGATSALSTMTSGITNTVSSPVSDATTTGTDLGSMLPTGTSGLSLSTTLPSGVLSLTPNVIPSVGSSTSAPTALTVTGAGSTMTVPLPTNSVGTSVSGPPTGTTGDYTAPGSSTVETSSNTPAQSTTGATTTGQSTTATGTAAGSSSPGYGTTVSTSVGLSSGTTLSIAPTGSSPTSIVQPTSSTATKTASTSPTDTAIVSSGTVQSTTAALSTQHTTAPETIQPTGTDTYTSLVLPTSWTFAPTTGTGSHGIATAPSGSNPAPSGLPTYMPQLVQPPGGLPVAPSNATLIQIGFNYGLNYPFVVNQPESASQIFAYLPQGIAFGLGISRDQVKMNSLRPYDTSSSLNYITTLAEAYIPSQLVNQLEMSLHMPLSEVYNNPNSPVKTLMHMINPTIPILPGASVNGASSSAWYNPAATATSSSGDGAPIGGDSGSSNRVRGSSVGIGVGAVCGAAVYAAAMVYVARRYRKKRSLHQRASSVPTAGEMSQASGGMGGFFMSGANGRGSAGSGSGGRASRTSAGSSNGRSVREQGISAPIMAENSLGWT